MKASGKSLRGLGRVGALWWLCAAPAGALQVLEAADHAELAAEVSASAVNRIALEGDRIARVVQSPGGFTVEHDPVRGDLYLYPAGNLGAMQPGFADGEPALRPDAQDSRVPTPVTLYLGTEKGFTYRLSLNPVASEPAQILIRNPRVANAQQAGRPASGNAAPQRYEHALAALVQAVATATPPHGYVIVPAEDSDGIGPGDGGPSDGIDVLEVWRGPRFVAHVLHVEAGSAGDAEDLARIFGPGVAAAWLGAAHGRAAHGRAAHRGSVHGGPAHASAADGGGSSSESVEIARSGGAGRGESNVPSARLAVVVEVNPAAEPGR